MPNQNIIFGLVIGELRVSPVAAVLKLLAGLNVLLGLPFPLPEGLAPTALGLLGILELLDFLGDLLEEIIGGVAVAI